MAFQYELETEDLDVSLDEELTDNPADAPLEYDPMGDNIARELSATQEGQDALRRIADYVLRCYDSARESTEQYRNRAARDLQFFTGEMPAKDWPYENCANGNVPIMLENMTRITARMYGELFGDWNNVFGVVPMGPDDDNTAQILAAHGNWQLRSQIKDFKRQMHRGVLVFMVFGDVIARSFYDPTFRSNRHEVLTPDDFCMPYAHVTVMPDLADVPYYAMELPMYRHQLEAQKGTWLDVEAVLKRAPPSWDEGELERPLGEATADTQLVERPDDDPNSPYHIVQWEGWLDLPQQDRQRFCQCIFDHDTHAILSLTVHEDYDWKDKMRYDREVRERDEYLMQKQAFAMAQEAQQQVELANQLAKEQQQQDALDTEAHATAQVALGVMDPAVASVTIDQAEQAEPELVPVPPLPESPLPPMWMALRIQEGEDEALIEPEPPAMEPIRMFSHGVAIEPLTGNLGVSYGKVQAFFNEGANVALNQFIDSATLGNNWSIITTNNLEFEGNFSIAPGKVNRLKRFSGDDLGKSIYPLQPREANPQLLQVVDKFVSYAQSSMQAPNVLSGEPGKSGETFRGISARIEQATKQLSVFTQKYADFLQQLLVNNGRLNAQHLPDEEIFYALNHLNTMQELRVGRKLYERDYRVEIRADLRFTTLSQRIAEADEMLAFAKQDPLLANNMRFQYEVRKKALEARNRHDLIPLLGEPPQPQPQFIPPIPPMPPGGPQGGPPPGGPGGPPPQGPPQVPPQG